MQEFSGGEQGEFEDEEAGPFHGLSFEQGMEADAGGPNDDRVVLMALREIDRIEEVLKKPDVDPEVGNPGGVVGIESFDVRSTPMSDDEREARMNTNRHVLKRIYDHFGVDREQGQMSEGTVASQTTPAQPTKEYLIRRMFYASRGGGVFFNEDSVYDLAQDPGGDGVPLAFFVDFSSTAAAGLEMPFQ